MSEKLLRHIPVDACGPAKKWLTRLPDHYTIQDAWAACNIPGWLWWLIHRADTNLEELIYDAILVAAEAAVYRAHRNPWAAGGTSDIEKWREHAENAVLDKAPTILTHGFTSLNLLKQAFIEKRYADCLRYCDSISYYVENDIIELEIIKRHIPHFPMSVK